MKLLAQGAAALLCASFSLAAHAAPENYTIEPNHTIPRFSVNHLGFSTHVAQFSKSAGKITLDTAAKSGSLDITIQAASFNGGGNEAFEKHVRGPDFFDVEKFPTMTYKSTKFNFNGDNLASVEGQFTMLGVTKPVTLTVTGFRCGNHPFNKKPMCGADATAKLKRSEFGMKTFIPAVSDEVALMIQVEALKD
jgi:polyisoprenoid-binding protein YceI